MKEISQYLTELWLNQRVDYRLIITKMKKAIILLRTSVFSLGLLSLSLLMVLPSYGQSSLLKRLERKVQEKVEDQATKRADRKLDEAVNKAFDKAEESLAGLGKNKDGSPIVIAETYSFDMGITYELRNEKKGKQEKMPQTTLWFGDQPYMGMSTDAQKSMFMVMENENMLTFLTDSKTYMALNAGMVGAAVANAADEESSTPEIKEVGTGTILGQVCKIYEIQDQDQEVRVWISPLKANTQFFMKAFAQIAKQANNQVWGMQEAPGLVLKVRSVDKKTNEITEMEATALHDKGMRFSTAGYKSMGF
jgi:hypothetical protein